MFRSRIVAVTLAVGLGGPSPVAGRAAASPYLVDFGYAPADTPEGIAESVPVTAPSPASTAPRVIIETPAAQIAVSPAANAVGSTTVIVGAPPPSPQQSRALVTRPPPAPEGGLGLMITGFSMFAASYLLTGWAGALVHDGESGCNGTRAQCREIGKALMIPFAGPIMAAQVTDGARETAGLLLVSAAQIATFTMGLVGAVRQGRYRRWERKYGGITLGRSGLAVRPIPRLDGGGLGLDYRF